jgi:uncharacterized protein DUF6941
MTGMRVNAFLADSAEAVQGKIYALGIGWNTIYARAFPVIHPRVAVGMTIHVPYTATNQMHSISLHLQTQDQVRVPLGERPGADGEGSGVVQELSGQFNVGRPPLLPPGDEQVVALAMTINGLQFPKPDLYSWVISIDGAEVRRLPMRVQQLVEPGPVGG